MHFTHYFYQVDSSIVETDESMFGKRAKYHRGQYFRQISVFGTVQRDTLNIVMKVVDNRRKDTLQPVLQKCVHVNATIYHDDCICYRNLHKLGYEHRTVNHTREFVISDGTCTNTIEGLWGNVKIK